MHRSIMVGVDGSREAACAARVAASLGRRLDHGLVLAHIANDPHVFPYGDRWVRSVERRRATERCTELLEDVATEIREPTARKRIVLSGAIQGRVKDRLVALSCEEDVDLLVVGARDRSAPAHALLGSMYVPLSRDAGCPVLVVPRKAASDPWDRQEPRPIICGVDGSVESDRARVVADELADRLGAPLLPFFVDRSGRPADARSHLRVYGPDPAGGITELARRARAGLIVVGTRGRQPLLGSVSRALVAKSRTPVLIVPPAARLPRFTASAAADLRLAA